MRALLLLVDLQRDYLEIPGLQSQASIGEIVDHAADLLAAFRAAGSPVLHLRTVVTRDPDTRMAHWKAADRWLCVKGTPGCEGPEPLAEREGELVLEKAGFSAETLVETVSRHGEVDTVVIAGVMLHACVRQAALALYQAGYRICIAEDAVGSYDPVHAAITRRYLEERTITFAPASSLAAGQKGGNLDLKFLTKSAEDCAAVLEAVGGAAAFAPAWRNTAPADRAALVERLRQPLLEAAESLAEEMAELLGKPVRFGRVEVERMAEMIDAVLARTRRATEVDKVGPALVRRLPQGVVGVITPWNNPVYIPLGKILPAILCGNAVVWKPAPEARAISRRLREIFAACEWPGDLVQIVEGGRAAGQALMEHESVDAVTITGSLAAGYSAMGICARRHVPLQAELGGNNAAIVWPDADVEAAAREIAAGAFDQAGQRCTANRRVIVHRDIAGRFLDLLERETAALPWGAPLDPETRIGPLVSESHRLRVARVLQRAERTGLSIVYPQGEKPSVEAESAAGWAWLPPAIVVCDDPAHELVQEEMFGPVLVVQAADDWDEALRLCNGVRQGLAAALFTDSGEIIQSFLDGAKAGILKINASTADAAVDVPFGGWKASGAGPPEHGDCDVDFYTRVQAIYRGGSPSDSD